MKAQFRPEQLAKMAEQVRQRQQAQAPKQAMPAAPRTVTQLPTILPQPTQPSLPPLGGGSRFKPEQMAKMAQQAAKRMGVADYSQMAGALAGGRQAGGLRELNTINPALPPKHTVQPHPLARPEDMYRFQRGVGGNFQRPVTQLPTIQPSKPQHSTQQLMRQAGGNFVNQPKFGSSF